MASGDANLQINDNSDGSEKLLQSEHWNQIPPQNGLNEQEKDFNDFFKELL